ncbi:MAG TPA: DndE family protein [Pseudobdellovibrionaceae bacterium]|mgnify:CR=1 FL=1|nr:DndE family protein [Pseudobdellovibrionaceae bacterium]
MALPNKIKLSEEATQRMKFIKSKTQLEDWMIARLGLCLSLGDRQLVDLRKYLVQGGKDSKEYNRYTISGEFDLLFHQLILTYRDRLQIEDLDESDLMRAHLNRGIMMLGRQVRSIGDVAQMLSKEGAVAALDAD